MNGEGTISGMAELGQNAEQAPKELEKLPNKDALLSELSTQIQNGKLASVAFIDLDNFKQVNDQHGHSEGDKCLVAVVASLAAVMLGKGKIYRVGGDEFCVLLPNFSSFEAAATAERIRLGLDTLQPFGGTTKVTTSIGVAACDARGIHANAESLVKAADEAMYVSKWTTKNRVTIWPAPEADRQLADDNRKRAQSDQRLSALEQQVQNLQTQQQEFAIQEVNREKEKQQRQQIKGQLAGFLKEAQGIQNSIHYNNPASLYEKSDWERRVEEYLADKLDQSFAVRFHSPKQQVTAFPVGMNPPMRGPWSDLTAKMGMLHDFISELRE